MPTTRVLRQSFAGGELAYELFGRIDLGKYSSGVEKSLNFFTLPHGPACNRPGTEFIGEVKDSTKATRVLSFSFSNEQTFCIEMGAGYFRFIKDGAQLTPGSPGAFAANSGAVTFTQPSAVVTISVADPSVITWAAHGQTEGTAVTFTTSGTLPEGLETGAVYYVRSPAAGAFYVSATPTGALLEVTAAGAGVHTAHARVVANRVGHGYVNGDSVAFTTTGTLPTGITTGVGYFVINRTANTFEIAAVESGVAIIATGIPAGVHTGHLSYPVASLVTYLGDTYYCKLATIASNLPTDAAYWYELPDPTIYEIPNPYAEAHLFGIRYTQSGDVVTLTHPSYAQRELKRYGNTEWVLESLSFGSQMQAPESCTAVRKRPTAGTNKDFYYKVTALDARGIEESPPSSASPVVRNDLTITGNYNTISWPAVSGASRYNVYKYANGTYGFIGQVAGTSLVDDNIIADLTKTIPFEEDPFTSANNYPVSCGYFEQRRFFGGSNNAPMNIWSTQSASDYNMSYSIPSQDSDALRFKIAANRANAIRHIVPLQDLILLTASTEWRVYSEGGALTATSLTIKAQSQNGASAVQPVTVNNYLLYEQAQGGHVREMAYQWNNQGYTSNDISLLAPHLFDGYTLVEMCFSRAPFPIFWTVSSNGKLLGMTYVPEQQVAGWHQHDTDGEFESCCTVTEGSEDALYLVVNRTIDGNTKRYIERLHSRFFTDPADAFFVDSGLTYSGVATDTITGLEHLEGKTVSILGDGAVMNQQEVVSGSITLEAEVEKAQVGLPITADLITLPTFFQDPTYGQSRVKNVNKVWVRVNQSGGLKAGPSTDRLTPIRTRSFETYGSPPDLKSEEVDLVVRSNWNDTGQVVIRQDEPLPLTIVYIGAEVAVGS
jgi:hypothetical protein